jgi:hypothetical protein
VTLPVRFDLRNSRELGIEKMQQALETNDVVKLLETILGWMRAGSHAP